MRQVQFSNKPLYVRQQCLYSVKFSSVQYTVCHVVSVHEVLFCISACIYLLFFSDHERLLADYGTAFTSAWKITHNYRVWICNKHSAMTNITPGHPFQGQYSVADVKIRLSHSMQNSERGKKIGNAVMSTSRSVVQTGKAVGQSVGGVLTVAKSAISSWFSMLAQPTAAVSASPLSAD